MYTETYHEFESRTLRSDVQMVWYIPNPALTAIIQFLMKNNKLIPVALLHALGVFLYTLLISWVMMNGENWFGEMNNVAGPALFLLLFVTSAAITGALVLGKPILLYLDNKKKDAINLFCLTVGWMVILIILTMAGIAII